MDRVLLIDDEEDLRDMVVRVLQPEGMAVETLEGREGAMGLIQRSSFDLVLLDLQLKDSDGFDLLREIREKYPALPVLILSARKESYNKVLGFGLGADDYITKPFINEELVARIKGNIRRSRVRTNPPGSAACEELRHGCFRLDLRQFILFKEDRKLELPSRLIKLMAFFMENPDQVFTKEQIYYQVWDDKYFDDQTVVVYIRKLREAVERESSRPEYIETVRGVGYKFNSMMEGPG